MSVSATRSPAAAGAPAPPDLHARLGRLAPSASKLRRPSLRAGLVPRPELVDRLRTGEPVVVLSAPAGYGKTTLLAQWAASEPRPVAWLTVTEGDNDVRTFIAYLVRALDGAEPLPPETLVAFTSPGADGPTVLLPRLGRALLERPRPFVLALDDVHLLTDADCLHALAVLTSHLPDGSQLALATRQDLPLARARLRTRGTLAEVRPEDLALSREEGVGALRSAGVDLAPEALGALIDRTEGWPAGLYLAALAVRGLPDAAAGALRFAGDHRLVAEYLRDELLDGLPTETVRFLTRTSVLEYLDGAGCDEVLERTGSWELLDELARSNLFVVPLDSTGEQYRYHHLFADLLQAELRRREPGEVPRLHRRASDLFARRDQPNLAIRHAHAAGDIALAAALVWRNVVPYAASGRSATVERWLSVFTRDELAAHPELPLACTWCCLSTRAPRPIADWLDLARAFGPQAQLADGTSVAAMVTLFEAIAGEQGIPAMVASAVAAHELFAADSPFRYVARYVEGVGLMLLGRLGEARGRLEEAVVGRSAVPGTAAGALSQLAALALESGDWDGARAWSDRSLALVRERQLGELPLQVIAFAVAALLHARAGRVEAAQLDANHARRLVARLNVQLGSPWLGVQARILLAQVALHLGDPEEARVLAREARDIAGRLPEPGIVPDRVADLLRAIDSDVLAGSELRAAPLTTAELRVLAYLPTHLSFQAMAEDLFVSRNTVKTQAISIYRKLGVSSRGEAVARARELGLLDT